ncbi:hypothetical protein HZI73_19915 [Vallitalea pronyensis]|uniref:Uncharacterized protein n=1 Tax=Vallitalea pronyensis TaxID=1348613 RepID=A0A8J8MME4_9FIRM|nr:hypothetical protein [Vallitalea pronyensis]QUI24425.1 hypothetical protein HZI73_19915 [Vallitalea pronyensis]
MKNQKSQRYIIFLLLAVATASILFFILRNRENMYDDIIEADLLASITSNEGFKFRDCPWLASPETLQDSNLVPKIEPVTVGIRGNQSIIIPKYSIKFTELDSTARVEYMFDKDRFYRGTYVFQFERYDEYERVTKLVLKMIINKYGESPIRSNINEFFSGSLDSDGKSWRSEEDGSFIKVSNFPTTEGELAVDSDSGYYYLGISVYYKMAGFDEYNS